MYFLVFLLFLWVFYYRNGYEFLCDLYYRYSVINRDVTPLGENKLTIMDISVYRKHSITPTKDKDYFYYNLWLCYLFDNIDIDPHKTKKVDWNYIDFILVEYNYNDKIYKLILNKDFNKSMKVVKSKLPPFYTMFGFSAKLYSHDNRIVDVTNDLLKYSGPFGDFYDFMDIPENRDIRYILNNYQLEDYIQLEIETYEKKITIDLEETNAIRLKI